MSVCSITPPPPALPPSLVSTLEMTSDSLGKVALIYGNLEAGLHAAAGEHAGRWRFGDMAAQLVGRPSLILSDGDTGLCNCEQILT